MNVSERGPQGDARPTDAGGPTQMVPGGRSAPALQFVQLPSPLAAEPLLFYEDAPEAIARRLRQSGSPQRVALAPQAPPDESDVRAVEQNARLRWASIGRTELAWGLWWLILGPALAVLWINLAPLIGALFFWLPPLAVLIGTLGAASGGTLLAFFVSLVPLVWAWRHAFPHLREAGRYRSAARALASRTHRTGAIERRSDPSVAAFVAESGPASDRLRRAFETLVEQGGDAAADGALQARLLYQSAARYGLRSAAAAYHALYLTFAAAERDMAAREGKASGVLAERRISGLAKKARRAAQAALAPFSTRAKVRSNSLVPVAGVAAGLAALVLVFAVTGLYWLGPDEAEIVQPPMARLGSLAGSVGGGATTDAATAGSQINRTPGLNWAWPRPFGARHGVTTAEQSIVLHAIISQPRANPARYDVLDVAVRYHVTDLDRWAMLDADGNGEARLGGGLSGVLQSYVQQQRAAAQDMLTRQNPNLANDQAQLESQTDQLFESRASDVVTNFMGLLGSSDQLKQAGVAVSSQAASRVRRAVPADMTGVPGTSG